MSLIRFVRQMIAQWLKCPHSWRPAKTSKGLARYCDLCETTEQLTQSEFYSYFGRFC